MFGIDSSTFDLIFQAHDEASPVIEGIGERLRGVTSIIGGGMMAGLGFEAFRGIEEGLSGLVGGAVSANMNVQSLRMTLQAIYGDAREASDAFTWLTQFEKTVPFSLPDLQQGAVTIASLGDDITKVMPAIAGAASVAQVSFTTATQAFMDAQNGLNRMMERDLHIRPEQLVPFGLQIDSKGKEDLNTFAAAFEKFVAARYPDAVANQMHTLRGELSSLETQWYNIEVAIGKPLFSVLQVDAQRLLDYLNTHQQDVQNLAANVGEGLAAVVGTISLAVPRALQLVGEGISAVRSLWTSLEGDLNGIGSFFDTLGTDLHEFLFKLVSGTIDLENDLFNVFAQSVDAALGAINAGLHKLYTATGGNLGIGPNDKGMSGLNTDAMTQANDKFKTLARMFPDLDFTGLPLKKEGAQTIAGGGGGSYSSAMPGVNMEDPAAVAAWMAAHSNIGANGLPVAGLGPPSDTAALKAAAQSALDQAKMHFQLDQIQGASQTKLLGDIATIIKDMSNKALGLPQIAIDLERAQDMRAIGALAKATTTGGSSSPLSGYRLPQEASYGNAVISLASVQQASQQESLRQYQAQISALEATIANLTAQLAAKEQQTDLQRQGVQHTSQIAAHTRRTADAATKPSTSLGAALRSNGVQLVAR